MNTGTPPTTSTKPRKRLSKAQRRVRMARNFLIIAVMATFVSVGGHCLTGDDAPATSAVTEAMSGQ